MIFFLGAVGQEKYIAHRSTLVWCVAQALEKCETGEALECVTLVVKGTDMDAQVDNSRGGCCVTGMRQL